MAFIDSETYRNVQNAFQVELIESATYQLYGEQARRDGYQQVGNIFDETARNESEHAEIWLKILNNGVMTSTLPNLQESHRLEVEATERYNQYAQIAQDEGYTDIANLFEAIGLIERHHGFRFQRLAENITSNQMFCKPNSAVWVCLVCGNLVWNECAPEICPVCGYPQGYYQLNCENY